jgi:hypothetical protein
LALELRRRKRVAATITNYGQKVTKRLLEGPGRGVTALQGTGIYASEARDVLLRAVQACPDLQPAVQ